MTSSSVFVRVGLSLSVVAVAAACGPSAAPQYFPEQAANVEFRALLGASSRDLWVTGFDYGSNGQRLFHGTSPGTLASVTVPAELTTATFSAVSAGPGALAVTWQVPNELPRVGVLSADGSFQQLDASALFGAARPAESGLGVVSRGPRFVVVATTPNLTPALRLFQREGGGFVELPALPAGVRTVQPVDSLVEEPWLFASDAQGDFWLRLAAGAWTRVELPAGGCFQRLIVRTPDDAWCGTAHWDGASWSTPMLEGPGATVQSSGGAMLPTGPAKAQAVWLSSGVIRNVGGTLTGPQDPRIEAFAQEARRDALAPARSIGVVQPECNGLTPCSDATWFRLEDGTAAFLLQKPNGSKAYATLLFAPSQF